MSKKNEQDPPAVTVQGFEQSLASEVLLRDLIADIQITPGTFERLKVWLRSEDARYITKLTLVLLAAGAFSAVAVVAPTGAAGLAQLLKPFITNQRRRQRIVQRLVRDGLFTAHIFRDGRVAIRLTKRGKKMALRAQAEALALTKPKIWDKQWRLVLFDVPEKDRTGREVLRRKLRDLGFWQIQKSAWLLPWPCEAELRLFRERFGFDEAIRILTIPDSEEFREARLKFFGK